MRTLGLHSFAAIFKLRGGTTDSTLAVVSLVTCYEKLPMQMYCAREKQTKQVPLGANKHTRIYIIEVNHNMCESTMDVDNPVGSSENTFLSNDLKIRNIKKGADEFIFRFTSLNRKAVLSQYSSAILNYVCNYLG